MKILITGAGTFIGNAICSYLIKKKNLIYGSYNSHKPSNLNKKIKLIKINLEKKIKFNKNFDLLIHCASRVPSDGINKKNYQFNINSLKKIIKICKNNKCKRIIFLSAMSVYGMEKKIIAKEEVYGKKLDYYGLSKKNSEEILINFSKKEKIITTIFRLPGVIGKGSKEIFLKKINEKIRKKQKILIYNSEKKFNNVIEINSLLKIIYRSIKKENINNIYNLGSKYPIKIKSIINILLRKYKINNNNNIIFKKKIIPNYIISIKKILKAGYKIDSTRKYIYKLTKI